MTTKTDFPTDNLVRGWTGRQTVTRAEEDEETGEKILHGEFARFNEWTEIDSIFEGRFMERLDPGAFDDTLERELERVKVLYDHGHDPTLGNKPLGPIRSVDATKDGVEYEVPLIDTDYNRNFIIPAADAGLLGASFRMNVRAAEWNDPDEPTEDNPEKLPERTITRVGLFEFGPVTFPAYEGASAGLRSRSDDFYQSMLTDGAFVKRFMERTSPQVAARVLDEAADSGYTGDSSAPGQLALQRSHQAALIEIETLRKRN